MTSMVGVHLIPAHGRPEDMEYISRMDPGSVKIVDPDVQKIHDVHAAAPRAIIVLRDHPLSEQHDDMARDPIGTGMRHADRWREKIREYTQQAEERGLTIPAAREFVVLGINEPRVWTHLAQTVEYTVAFIEQCEQHGLRPGALNLSVGWPANTGTDAPPDWAPYAPIEAPLKAAGGFLFLHEYWSCQYEKVDFGWGWWCDRLRHCPWMTTPIIIGECGVDNGVRLPYEGSRGWQGHATPASYAGQVLEYANAMKTDGRVHSFQIFTTDYNKPWGTFDTLPAHNDLIATTFPTYSPIEKPPTEPPIKPPPQGGWHYPAAGMVTQRWGENYQYYFDTFGFNGHNGLDIAHFEGADIVAFADGEVMFVGRDAGYGNYIRLWHPQLSIFTFYAHLRDKPDKSPGNSISGGEVIGKMGNTGNSTGPHLHFEIRMGANPFTYGYTSYGHTQGRVDPELIMSMMG